MFQIGKLKGKYPGPEHEEWGVSKGSGKKEERTQLFVQNVGTSFLHHGNKGFWNYLPSLCW